MGLPELWWLSPWVLGPSEDSAQCTLWAGLDESSASYLSVPGSAIPKRGGKIHGRGQTDTQADDEGKMEEILPLLAVAFNFIFFPPQQLLELSRRMEPGEVSGPSTGPFWQPATVPPGVHPCLQIREQALPAQNLGPQVLRAQEHPLLTASCTMTPPERGDQPLSKTLQKAPKSPSSSKRTFCHDENDGHVCCPICSMLIYPVGLFQSHLKGG